MKRDDRKSIFAWAMYDWANSAFATTVMAAFFPIFFKQFWSLGTDPVDSTAKLAMANSLAGIIIALSAPVLGAIADRGKARKRFLLFFACLGCAATAGLSQVARGDWPLAAALYALAITGFLGGNIFYDALLPVVASEKRMDMVSSLGYALGYLGGGLLFALNVWMTLKPAAFGLASTADAVQASFLSVGIWWAFFSLPLLLIVREPLDRREISIASAIRGGLAQLGNTFRQIRKLKTIFLFLAAYWFYIDGVNTIIVMALDYGLSIGFKSTDLILALLVTQFIGFPSALAFGYFSGKTGTKAAIYLTIAVYLLLPCWGFFMNSRAEFYLLAMIIGLVQGGIQALSRSFYCRIIPADQPGEYFGFYNLVGKFAVVMGPLLIGGIGLWVRSLGYSSNFASRIGILSIAALFLLGGVLFYFVDEKKGKEELRHYLAGYQGSLF